MTDSLEVTLVTLAPLGASYGIMRWSTLSFEQREAIFLKLTGGKTRGPVHWLVSHAEKLLEYLPAKWRVYGTQHSERDNDSSKSNSPGL